MTNGETKLYLDFHFPVKVVQFIMDLIFGREDKGEASWVATSSSDREWFSQPRTSAEGVTEVITTIFKLPLSLSEITTEILRVPCVTEVWYQDRSNNWRPLLDMQRTPLRINVSRSDAKSFYKYHSKVYPVVAKQVQFRITRTSDPSMQDIPYVVGLRNSLLRRNVYDRNQGSAAFEDEQDILGNVITKYIKDWDAPQAVDDDPVTYWKSAPMPDPKAVASLCLDLRGDLGEPVMVDKVYIDPTHSGCHLNLYFSNDDFVGTRYLNPVSIAPSGDANVFWRIGEGRADTASGVEESYYRWPLALGPLAKQNAWLGVSWRPGFDPLESAPPTDPVLFSVKGSGASAYRPTLSYSAGSGEFVLSLDSDSDLRTYTASVTQFFAPGDSLRIVAGWRYGTDGESDSVLIKVVNNAAEEIATLDVEVFNLPRSIVFDGMAEFANFRGVMLDHVVKLDDYRAAAYGIAEFLRDPDYYTDPDPVVKDSLGRVPSSSLDNAVYAACWVSQEHGRGGSDSTHFEDKEWTPVWRDYVCEKGMLYLPRPQAMKYLKLEFSNLTEEPYPIYDSDIEVRYKVFPVSVVQESSVGPRQYSGDGGFLGLGSIISTNGVRTVNWLNINSVQEAIGAVFNPQTPPVVIADGLPYVTDTMPNLGQTAVQESWRVEMASTYVYRRETLQPYILAEDAYQTIIKAEGLQAIQAFTDVPWSDIAAANPGAISHVRSVGALPVRGTDYWVFPGQQLKIPATTMQKLTDTSTVTERKLTLEHRVRFNTSSVHRYEYRTVKRDSAVAYFAGLREVIPFTSTFIPNEDRPVFDFPSYSPDQWELENIRTTDAGPITADGLGANFFKSFETMSSFSKLSVKFYDSGLLRSNPMWQDIAPESQSIDDLRLSDWVRKYPAGVPVGMWTDSMAVWGTEWEHEYPDGLGKSQVKRPAIYISSGASPGPTMPTPPHQTDDLIVAFVMFSGTHGESEATVPDGWTVLEMAYTEGTSGTYQDQQYSTGGCTGVLAYKRAASAAEEFGDWEHAISVSAVVYRNASIGNYSIDAHYTTLEKSHLSGGRPPTFPTTHLSEDPEDPNADPDTLYRSRYSAVARFVGFNNQGGDGIIFPNSMSGYKHGPRAADLADTWVSNPKYVPELAEVVAGQPVSDGAWCAVSLELKALDFNTIPDEEDRSNIIGERDVTWGQEAATVSITLDETKVYQGNRVLKFRRAAGGGVAGIRLRQVEHFIPGTTARLGAVFYKPYDTTNEVTLILRRTRDSVRLYEETKVMPHGRWIEYTTQFFDIPENELPGEEYEIILTIDGDDADEMLLSDLYTEISHIRYYINTGGVGGNTHEVTDLRYVKGVANVVSTVPVNQFTIDADIFSDEAWAFGCTIVPTYLH